MTVAAAWACRSPPSRPPGATTTTTAGSTSSSAASTGSGLPDRATPAAEPDPRNRCRLYRNQGDGTFVDVAAEAGVLNERWAKGSAWGDYDDDGWLDLFVSNMDGPARLYRNQRRRHLRRRRAELGVTGPPHGFACWFWDYDNDGRLDLFVDDFGSRLAEVVADRLGLPVRSDDTPTALPQPRRRRLPRREPRGRARPGRCPPMGCNFGDIDNDGYLDLYLGTGLDEPLEPGPQPDVRERRRPRFEDVTASTGTGHLQKGHGVSFADWDGDGDLDLFVDARRRLPRRSRLQRPLPEPRPRPPLAEGQARRHEDQPVGHRRQAAGRPGGPRRPPARSTASIGNNGSFGGNTLVESIGLLDADDPSTALTVTWPTSKTTQTFRDLAADQAIEITEGADAFKVVTRRAQPSPER